MIACQDFLCFSYFFFPKNSQGLIVCCIAFGQLVVCIALDFFAYTLRDSGQLVLSFIYFGLGQDILLISSYILAIYFCFLLLYIQVNQYTVSSLQIWSRPFFPVAQVLFLKLLNLIFQSTQNFYESCTFKFAFSSWLLENLDTKLSDLRFPCVQRQSVWRDRLV